MYDRYENPETIERKFAGRTMTREEYYYWCAAQRAYKTGRASSAGVGYPRTGDSTFVDHLRTIAIHLRNLQWWRDHCPECEYRAVSQRYRDYLYGIEADAGEALYVAGLERAVSLYHAGYNNPSVPV